MLYSLLGQSHTLLVVTLNKDCAIAGRTWPCPDNTVEFVLESIAQFFVPVVAGNNNCVARG